MMTNIVDFALVALDGIIALLTGKEAQGLRSTTGFGSINVPHGAGRISLTSNGKHAH